MKNLIIKITLFLSCFAVGAGFVWGAGFFSRQFAGSPVIAETTEVKVNPVSRIRKGKGLEVKFQRIVETENGLAVDFEITNFEDESYYYSAYNEEKGAVPFFALYQVKINGREENLRWCGNGLKQFELESGESKIFRVYNLSFNWQENKSLQYGFHLSRADAGQSRLFWSENLPIDAATAKILSKEKEKYK